MNIKSRNVTVRELVVAYSDNGDEGVTAYNDLLDIRPPYQREFIYDEKQRNAVIDTIIKGYPLNVMYWAVRDDGCYEIIDGQQRTISICQYLNDDFTIDGLFFFNLPIDIKESIYNYKLTVYLCDGAPSEKLAWFRTINIAGVKLSDQELRNAVYHGSYITSAKKYFSKNGCPAHGVASRYMSGSHIRQDYLETVLNWISNDNIELYMASNQRLSDAGNLWEYFEKVIDWVEAIFTVYRSEMKGIEWGHLYNEYSNNVYIPEIIENKVKHLMLDDDVTRKSGIYYYSFDDNERHLNIRQFSDTMKRQGYENQSGICAHCKNSFSIEGMEADHIKPWSKGGKTDNNNIQLLCKDCNRRKSNH